MNQFEIPQNLNPMENIIKVIGVGGGGSNAVKHLFNLNVKNVDFIVCNTDQQHLLSSPIPNKIQLGKNLTKGLGAGCIPDVGREAAIESREEIKQILENKTEMLFIAAGLGGGTGTGAAPVIAEIAKSLNILTVAIVTLPFKFEGKQKAEFAEKGLESLRKYVDSIIIIPNEKLKKLYPGMKMSEAFAKADDIVSTAAKSIAEIITNNLHINVDFNDVRTIMQNSGTAIMGTAIARGENRALEALKNAINHPLLMDTTIEGARSILLSITAGSDDITTEEFDAITDYVTEASGGSAHLIAGYGIDPSLGDAVSVTIVATGFQTRLAQNKSTESPFIQVTNIETVHLSENTPKQSETPSALTTEKHIQTQTPTPSTDFKIEEVQNTSSEETTSINSLNTSKISTHPKQQLEEKQESSDLFNSPMNDTDKKNTHVETLELSGSTEDSPNIAKIIEKKPSDNSESTLEQLSSNIKILSEKSHLIRKQIMDLNNPSVYQELENKPAYLRKKETETESEVKKQNPFSKDHSNYTIDENGNMKPGSPYLNDQVD